MATPASPRVAGLWRPWSLRLGDFDAGRDNNLNALRFVAASLVVFSHSYPLSGNLHDEPLARAARIIDFATLAVIVFFAISGYLVARSFDRSSGLGSYLGARGLRILPAYTVAILLGAFVVGPIATTLPLADYLADPQTWRYVGMNFTLVQHDRLPGVFAATPLRGGVNGSLWTLPIEIVCYGALAFAGLVGALRRRWLALALAVALWLAGERVPGFVALLPHSDAFMTPRLAGLFVAGALAYAWRDKIPVSPWIAMAALAVGIALIGMRLEAYALLGAIGYSTLVLAFHPALDVPGFRRFGDYSYGLYVYAFPTQQLVVWATGLSSPWLLFAIAYPVTLGLAVASWKYVERPALRLKRRAGGTEPA